MTSRMERPATRNRQRKEEATMEHHRWLSEWLPPGMRFNTRAMTPENTERAIMASAANQFASAITSLAQANKETPGSPEDAARELATKAAVLERYVWDTAEYIDVTPFKPEDEWEEENPEMLQCEEQLRAAAKASDTLSAQAKESLEEFSIPLQRRDLRKAEQETEKMQREIQESNQQYHRLQGTADMAATLGSAAALNWIMDQLEDEYDGEHQDARMAAVVLAMWPNEEYLMLRSHQELPPQAKETLERTMRRVMEATWTIEEHRPTFISDLVEPKWERGECQDLTGHFSNAGPEANASMTGTATNRRTPSWPTGTKAPPTSSWSKNPTATPSARRRPWSTAKPWSRWPST